MKSVCDIARSKSTGLYWGGGAGGNGESFCVVDPAQAVAFGDAHRAYSDLSNQTTEFEWVQFAAEID